MLWDIPPLSSLLTALTDPTLPVGMRMRATYYLRQVYENYMKNQEMDELKTCNIVNDADFISDDTYDHNQQHHDKRDITTDLSLTVIQALTTALSNMEHGSLLRHEFAYVLGQLRDARSVPSLESTLLNETDDTMVRHECAEALGAIGSTSCLPTLRKVASEDASIEVGQTCHLALDFIQWKEARKGRIHKNNGQAIGNGHEEEKDEEEEEEEEEEDMVVCACMLPPYSSVDPAPPHPKHVTLSSHEIGTILRNVNAPLFERFRAMFSLRNRGGEESVHELGNALVTDESSALLRHEVAYVLGQMQHPHAVEYLTRSLERNDEHRMVRHESAEALGAIEERWGECESVLRKFLQDEDDVVRESCVVALDAADYWGYNRSIDNADDDNPIDESNSKTLRFEEVVPMVEEHRRINFSLHKAHSNGKTVDTSGTKLSTPGGVLHNHFNLVT